MTESSFHVVGHPRPQPRPRFVRGRVISTLDANARTWRDTLATACRDLKAKTPGPADLGPALSLDLAFQFPTREDTRWGCVHTFRPDLDNLAKLVQDVLADEGMLGGDDAAICRLSVSKHWAKEGGVKISILPA